MPEPRPVNSNPEVAEQHPGSDEHEPREVPGPLPPPPKQDRRGDETEYTGRDWRDDRGDRGTHRSGDTDRDRREPTDGRAEGTVRASAGPVTTVERSGGWAPVLSGAATAFAVFLIFSALWVAIAASGVSAVGENLEWFQLVSGVLAATAGGAAAGWLDPRGAMTGFIQGLATWGLLVIATTVAGLTTGPALLRAVGAVTWEANIEAANVTELLQPFEVELWVLFAVLLGGAVVAGLAGALTGRAHAILAVDDQTHRDQVAYDRGRVVDERRAPLRSGSRRR